MLQYLTYSEYTAIGGRCDIDAFNRYSVRVFGIISNETHGRISNMPCVPNAVKYAVRDLIDYYAANASTSTVTVSSRSQTTGTVSESESYIVKSAADIEADAQNIIEQYLLSETDANGTPLLYRGAR